LYLVSVVISLNGIANFKLLELIIKKKLIFKDLATVCNQPVNFFAIL